MSPSTRRTSVSRARAARGASGLLRCLSAAGTTAPGCSVPGMHLAAPHIGIDEAGRGCLAGPVVAAAVILPPHADAVALAALLPDLAGLTDSKKLTAARREALAPCIRRHAVAWGLGVIWPRDIERINILQATFHAMWRAVRSLHRGSTSRKGAAACRFDPPALPDLPLIIDGDKTIPPAVLAGLPPRPARHAAVTAMSAMSTMSTIPGQRAVVGGDALIPSVSAASILAKTFRDRLMTALDRRYPGYGFAAHKGYGTPEHCAAIAALGPCPQHRATFRKVRPQAPQPQGKLW